MGKNATHIKVLDWEKAIQANLLVLAHYSGNEVWERQHKRTYEDRVKWLQENKPK